MTTEVHEGYKMTELGEIPVNWDVKFLSSVSNIKMGQSPPSNSYNQSEQGLPFFQGNADFGEKNPKIRYYCTEPTKIADRGDILISVRAPVGSLNVSNIRCCVGRGLAAINANDNCSQDFLYYLLQKSGNQLKRVASGSTFEAINQNDLKHAIIPLPPLPEQQKIASILSSVDETIEKTGALIEKYRQIKKGLMSDLLTKGIDEQGRVRSEDTHEFKDSVLERVPVEWECPKLGEIYKDLTTGSTPSRTKPQYFKGNILWVTSGELKYKIITNTKEKITQKAVEQTNLKLYPPGTFFIAITGLEAEGTRGSCAIIGKSATTNQSCMAFLSNKKIDTIYLYQYYLHYGNSLIYQYSQGTKQQSLNGKIVKQIHIPLPPLPEQKRIAKILTAADQRIEKEEAYKSKLLEIKKGLMSDLLTGRVRV